MCVYIHYQKSWAQCPPVEFTRITMQDLLGSHARVVLSYHNVRGPYKSTIAQIWSRLGVCRVLQSRHAYSIGKYYLCTMLMPLSPCKWLFNSTVDWAISCEKFVLKFHVKISSHPWKIKQRKCLTSSLVLTWQQSLSLVCVYTATTSSEKSLNKSSVCKMGSQGWVWV